MKKFTFCLKIIALVCLSLGIFGFYSFNVADEQTVFIQHMLTKYYDNDAQSKDIKRYELVVTNNGFCRHKKFFTNGKQELFSFNLSSFKTMDFYGSSTKGELYLRTNRDDVIVQTRNDKKGDIDSMGTFMVIPLKNISVDELNELTENFKKFKTSLVAQK